MSHSLSLLPVEIISLILGYIDDQLALCRLARCSRFLLALATPYLYRDVTLKKRDSLPNFTRHILKNPHLASIVEIFSVAFDVEPASDSQVVQSIDSAYKVPQSKYSPRHDDSLVLARATRAAGHSERDQIAWLAELYGGRRKVDALLALLLPALVNLQHLDTSFPQDSAYCFRMLQCNLDERTCAAKGVFGRLSHLQKTWRPANQTRGEATHSHNRGLTFEELGFFFRIPSLRSFRGRIHRPTYTKHMEDRDHFVHGIVNTRFLAPGSFAGVSSNVTHFELWDCNVHIMQIARVLRACQSLRTFIFECGQSAIDGSGNVWNSAAGLSTNLSHVAQTLEKLVLTSINRQSRPTPSRRLPMPPMTSLAHFPKLKDVSLGVHYLLDASLESAAICHYGEDTLEAHRVYNILPSSIERLCLTQFSNASQEVLTRIIDDVVGCSSSRFPSLRETTIGIYRKHYAGDLTPWKATEVFLALSRRCSDADVLLTTSEHRASISERCI